MTIEEKARAYDEALERASHIKDNNTVATPQEVAEHIFPQLSESEDEKTRKRLIEFISDIKRISESGRNSWAIRKEDVEMCNAFLSYLENQKALTPADGWDYADKRMSHPLYLEGFEAGLTVERELSEFEKQKEPNGEDEECTDFTIYHPLKNGKGKYECIPYSFHGSLTSFSEDKDLIDFLRTCFYTEEECNEWIEQQKERKPVDYEHEMWKNCVANFEGGKKEVIEHPEKYGLQKEQKPAEIDEYEIIKKHITEDLLSSEVNKRLKECGWYVTEQKPINNSTREKIISRATSEKQVVLISESSGNAEIGWDTRSLEDAKKLLEYGLAFINKQLNIKPVAWDQDDEQYLLICKNALQKYQHSDQWDANIISDWLEKRLRSSYQQKQEWSKKDEVMLDRILESYKALDAYIEDNTDISEEDKIYNKKLGREETVWLQNRFKFLCPQSQKLEEWSEEDKEMLDFTIKLVEHSAFSTIGKGKNNVLAWLKSLPERFNSQPKQEWSGEEKGILLECVSVLQNMGHWLLADKLKSLRPQSHWKPSNEQINYLGAAVI